MRTLATRGGALAYDASGAGMPVLALHGAYSTHREVRAALEPVLRDRGLRVLYPDLPGMGDSPADGIHSADDVLDALEELIDAEAGGERMLVVGHSFGGHLARGIAARRPDQIAGLALLNPLMTGALQAETGVVIGDPDAADDLDSAERAEFEGYFVVRTAATVARFRESVLPSLGRYDARAVERIMDAADLHPDPLSVPVDAPTLIVTSRHDAFVGYRRQQELVDVYPRSTAVLVADAGHALIHERPDLIAALLVDWLDRTGIPTP